MATTTGHIAMADISGYTAFVAATELEHSREILSELLEVTTRAKESTAATLTLDQRVARDGRDLFTAEVMVVLVSASGKPMRLSAALRDALQDKPASM